MMSVTASNQIEAQIPPSCSRLSRRTFLAGASLVAIGPAACFPRAEAGRGRYRAAVIGCRPQNQIVAEAWAAEPAIEVIAQAGGLGTAALAALELVRPQLLAICAAGVPATLLPAAAARGVRAVYVDAPLTEPGQLQALHADGQRLNLQIAMAQPLLATGLLSAMRERIAAGDLGRLLEIRASVSTGGRCDLLRDCRDALSVAFDLGGRPLSCRGRIYSGGRLLPLDAGMRQWPADVDLHAWFRTDRGTAVHLDARRNSQDRSAAQITATGSRGRIKVRVQAVGEAMLRAAAEWSPGRLAAWQPLDRPASVPESQPHAAARAAASELAASLEHRQESSNLQPLCTAQDMLQLLVTSHRQGQQFIHFQ